MSDGERLAAGSVVHGRPVHRGAPVAVGTMIASVAFLVLVAVTPHSPLSPVTPMVFGPFPPMSWLSHVLSLSPAPASRGVLGTTAMAFMTGAFLLGLYHAWNGRLRARTVVGLGVAFQVVMVLLPLMVSKDVFSYAVYGRILSIHHANPYVSLPESFPRDPFFPFVSAGWREVPSAYWPGFVLFCSLVVRAVRSPAAVVFAFKLISGGAGIASLVLAGRLARRVAPDREAFACLLIGWNPVVLVQSIGAGHVDTVLMLALVGALLLANAAWTTGVAPSRSLALELWATAALAAGVLVKPTMAWPLILLVVAASMRRPAGSPRVKRFAAHLAVSAGLIAAVAGPFLQTKDPTLGLAKAAAYESLLAPSRFWSGTVAPLFVTSPGVDRAVGLAIRFVFPAVFLVCFLALVRRFVRGADRLDVSALGAGSGWALLVFLLAAPILFPWYLAWVLPVVWLLPSVPRGGAIILSAVVSVSETAPTRSVGRLSLALFERNAFAPALTVLLIWVASDLVFRLRRSAAIADVPVGLGEASILSLGTYPSDRLPRGR